MILAGGSEKTHPTNFQPIFFLRTTCSCSARLFKTNVQFILFHFRKFQKDCFSAYLNMAYWRKLFNSNFYKVDVEIMLGFLYCFVFPYHCGFLSLLFCFSLSLRFLVSPLSIFFFCKRITLEFLHFWKKVSLY